MKLNTILLSFLLLNISCKGQDKDVCSEKIILQKIKKLPEVINDSINLSKSNKKLIYQIYDDSINNKIYKVVKEAVDDRFHISTLRLYYIDENCDIFLYDSVQDTLLSTNKMKKMMEKNSKKIIEFTDLFNEGIIIKFTPNDLQKDNSEIKSFKQKLLLFENENTLSNDFDINNLFHLINNETFFDLQNYTDSSWLEYFIIKYKIDATNLHDLMKEAIRMEDFNAVKILIHNNYIVSKKDLEIISMTEKDSQNKIAENKIDEYESYLIKNFTIKDISITIKKNFINNHIQDSDGYTNLRKDKTSTSEILQKITTGEKIEVLDNTSDWFLVKTKEGKEGYVHKSRIKSN